MESTSSPFAKPTDTRRPRTLGSVLPWINRFRPDAGITLEPDLAPGPGYCLRVHGSLTARTAVRFKQAIRAALENEGPLTLDLGDVTRLDPTGLAALAEACELARRRGYRLLIANLPPSARQRLSQASLHKIITLAAP